MKIVDCFPFFNELDLLEVRLNSLAPYMDKFVLCEMPVTHSGKPKPLFFQENKERFKDFNITHLIAPPYHRDSWRTEHYQREYLMNGLHDVGDDEIILLSDADEIPDLSQYDMKTEGSFRQKMYYYYFNLYIGVDNWRGTVALKKKNMLSLREKNPLNKMRNLRERFPVIHNSNGWHFSTLGSIEDIIYKIESFAHIELDKDEFKSKLKERRMKLEDPYSCGAPNWRQDALQLTVEDPSGPKWLLQNKHKYPHLWCNYA